MGIIVGFLTTIYEAIITVMFVNTYAAETKGRSFYIYVIAVFGLAGMISLSNHFFHLGYFNVVLLTVFNFLVAYLFGKRFKLSVMLAVILTTIFAVTEVATLFALTLFLKASVMEITTIEIYRILGTILSKLFAFIVIKVICVKHKSNQEFAMKTSYWILFFLIFVVSTLAIYLLYTLQYYSMAPDIYNNLAVGCALGLLYTMFFSLYLYEKTIKQAAEEQQQEVFRQQVRAQAKYVDEILVAQTEIKKLRHDMRNHNIAIKAYLDSQDYMGATQYLENIQKNIGVTGFGIDTGNVAFDAIINTKRKIAKSKGIEFTVRLQMPENLFLDPIDICIIFGNALDNAIEACERLQSRSKWIEVSLTYAENALICKISNAAEKTNKDFLQTVKADKKKHGFGIGNIKTALEKYNGVYKFNQTDKEFTLFFKITNKEA